MISCVVVADKVMQLPARALVLALVVFCSLVCATHHYGNQAHHRALHVQVHHNAVRVNASVSSISNGTSSDLVNAGLSALRKANKYRLDNPRFNKRAFPPSAAALQSNATRPVSLLASHQWKCDNTSFPRSHDYTVPPELALAAAEVAETTHQDTIATGQATVEAEALKRQYWGNRNETNVPLTSNGTLPVSQPAKRDTLQFWMEQINMNGKAPYADADYTVFRNVRDFGAKGDGKTDDTDAINRAIASGDRCGQGCGSSTRKPAVVYFPEGTYLVSRSIVQYYNTQFIGNPINRSKILAATSFTGMGVFSSDVYIDNANGAEWYIPQNNFQRSIRHFVIDVSNADPNAYIAGIHWQVAQATDLQHIDFYMKPGTTQQGIYMENGSGGFMSNLYFYGGNFGAYLGNQQFTTRNLIFYNCKTAVQIHWDWAWTMQQVVIVGGDQSQAGITIIGGAGGPGSTGQGVGSFVLLDSMMINVPKGIVTSLLQENSTSMLIQNVQFQNTPAAVIDAVKDAALIPGSAQLATVDSWGFGRVVLGNSGASQFTNGAALPSANRSSELTQGAKNYFFSRSSPTYEDTPTSHFINIKSMGAHGDGQTDDTAIINQVLEYAANSSSVVFFPYGDYVVSNTINVPASSRIVGQAWSQIRATGANFANENTPIPVIRVGRTGDVGIVEISDMLFTTSAGSIGAKVVEWNIQESIQGSAAMWHTPIRVGGAVGSNLQAKDCPKGTHQVKRQCIAAGLLFHLTSTSSAYLENVWMWTADHDLDIADQTQIDVYSGRGMLMESRKASWLWGTASEHNVLYQYQLSGARNVFISMLQTESPYFQPAPKAPEPFTIGIFPNDPTFNDCKGSALCSIAWALRLIDSSNIFVYSAGLYSWFSDYTQDCVARGDCQASGVEIEQSTGLWLYTLATKGMQQMVSPKGAKPTLARDNENGFLSFILGWLEASVETIGGKYTGWRIMEPGSLARSQLPKACEDAMYQLVRCADSAKWLQRTRYATLLANKTMVAEICDLECRNSLRYNMASVESACQSKPDLAPGVPLKGMFQSIGDKWNLTCLLDPQTGEFCNDVLNGFPKNQNTTPLPRSQLCSYCNVNKLALMQGSPYSGYDNSTVEQDYKYVATTCNKNDAVFDPSPGGFHPNNTVPPIHVCVSGKTYLTSSQDTCDSIANAHNVSSAALFWINPLLQNCSSIQSNQELCLPLSCSTIYKVQSDDTCLGIAMENSIRPLNLFAWNPALNETCSNLHSGVWGSTLCTQQLPQSVENNNATNLDPWTRGDGIVAQNTTAPSGSVIADGTTEHCGGWYTASKTDTCTNICIMNGVIYPIFIGANPSLRSGSCDANLSPGKTYCVHPSSSWNATNPGNSSSWDTGSSMFGGALVIDNFNNGTMGSLVAYSDSNFKTAANKLVAVIDRGSAKAAFSGIWSNFTVEGDVAFESNSGIFGFFIRASNITAGSDKFDGYYVSIGNQNSFKVSVFNSTHNDGLRLLKEAALSDLTSASEPFHLKVKVLAGSITVYVNDIRKARLAVEDAAYAQGAVGVYAFECDGCSMDNIRLASPQSSEVGFDFAAASLDGWQTADPNVFSASTNALVGKSAEDGRILAVKTIAGDLVFEADMALPASSSGNAGLVFNVTEAGSGNNNFQGYYVGFDVNGFVLINCVNHDSKELARASYGKFHAGSVFHVMVQATQTSISVFVDDMTMPLVYVPIVGSPLIGQFGVRLHNTDVTVHSVYAYSL